MCGAKPGYKCTASEVEETKLLFKFNESNAGITI